ncbi:hypothetical protein D3C77_385340 [compost metagenome]
MARLELSFISDAPTDELMPASKAKEMSTIARQSIPATVKKRILDGINRAVSMGHATAGIQLDDLELDALPEQDLTILMDGFSSWLGSAGYIIEWDGPDSVWIRFDEL